MKLIKTTPLRLLASGLVLASSFAVQAQEGTSSAAQAQGDTSSSEWFWGIGGGAVPKYRIFEDADIDASRGAAVAITVGRDFWSPSSLPFKYGFDIKYSSATAKSAASKKFTFYGTYDRDLIGVFGRLTYIVSPVFFVTGRLGYGQTTAEYAITKVNASIAEYTADIKYKGKSSGIAYGLALEVAFAPRHHLSLSYDTIPKIKTLENSKYIVANLEDDDVDNDESAAAYFIAINYRYTF